MLGSASLLDDQTTVVVVAQERSSTPQRAAFQHWWPLILDQGPHDEREFPLPLGATRSLWLVSRFVLLPAAREAPRVLPGKPEVHYAHLEVSPAQCRVLYAFQWIAQVLQIPLRSEPGTAWTRDLAVPESRWSSPCAFVACLKPSPHERRYSCELPEWNAAPCRPLLERRAAPHPQRHHGQGSRQWQSGRWVWTLQEWSIPPHHRHHHR